LNTVIGTKIDEAARALGETGHTTGSTGVKSLNRQFHLRQTAADIVGDRVNKDAALRLLSPSTYGTGLVTGGFAGADDFRQGNYASGLGKAAVGFAAGAVGNNLIKNREKMIAARSLDVLSRGIKKVDMTKNLIKSATTGRLAQTRFGGAIMQAAQSGDRGKIAATNYVLSEQFPEYRQAKDADEEEQEMSHE